MSSFFDELAELESKLPALAVNGTDLKEFKDKAAGVAPKEDRPEEAPNKKSTKPNKE